MEQRVVHTDGRRSPELEVGQERQAAWHPTYKTIFFINTYVPKRATLRKGTTTKVHAPWGHNLRQCIATLEGTFFDAHYRERQSDELELLTALPYCYTNRVDASLD